MKRTLKIQTKLVFSILKIENYFQKTILPVIVCLFQRLQSGLKSGRVADPGKKEFDFPGKFRKKIASSRPISYKFRFSRQIPKIFRFLQAISQIISIFQAKICHLQLLLGKLFYFSSKVTAFEHTSCT